MGNLKGMEEIIRIMPDLRILIKGIETPDDGPVAQALKEFMKKMMELPKIN